MFVRLDSYNCFLHFDMHWLLQDMNEEALKMIQLCYDVLLDSDESTENIQPFYPVEENFSNM